MAWIELHQSVTRHPKTYIVADRLKIHRLLAVGHLVQLWLWALDAVPEGGPLTEREAGRGAEWDGDHRRFARALLGAGYLDRDEKGRLWLHNFAEYSQKLNERRAKARERKQRERSKVDSFESDVTRDSHTNVTPTNQPTNQPSSAPSERPTRRAFKDVAEDFHKAEPKDRVAHLIDLGDYLGLPRNNGMAAAIVRDYGHGREVVDALVSAARQAGGNPWEYAKGVLRNGRRQETRRRDDSAGARYATTPADEVRRRW